jgi:transcriptional regulator with XRE-family HTH domain
MSGTRDKGPFLREWRDYHGFTLVELAERLGITHGTLSRYETGKRRLSAEALQRLANELTSGFVPQLFVKPRPGMTPGSIKCAFKRGLRARKGPVEDLDTKLERVSREAASKPPQKGDEDEILDLWAKLTPPQRLVLREIVRLIRSLV